MYTPVGIELPEYYEWVRGTAYPKVNPGNPHGRFDWQAGDRECARGADRAFRKHHGITASRACRPRFGHLRAFPSPLCATV